MVESSGPGFVNAWIDFDGDGSWDESDDQIAIDVPVQAGTNTIGYSVRAGNEVPMTYARVRLTSYDTGGALSPGGLATDGEVEDYRISGTPLFADGFETGSTDAWIVLPERRIVGYWLAVPMKLAIVASEHADWSGVVSRLQGQDLAFWRDRGH